VDAGRMRANLEITRGAIVAERLSAHLTPRLGKAAAMRAVASAAGRGGELAEALARDPAVVAVFDTGTLERLCDPADYLGATDLLVQRVLCAGERSTG
jgi:3-carboxy-cis,cis-muconate cycloisomerase